ncbi:hypothetical protein EZI54_06980 [Marinobacter halodurans]|uniref:XRE family transcriptional regulator n=1 Tax=Marinobacter halodurans TaxID=2528979 RepID=A0ABY1ZM54_9GAMM|nr:hypothetical protein [Marinobacter halodurans]TBW57394.1 hypothetical protein EZI54_06980 [Marinobacter halodurans]
MKLEVDLSAVSKSLRRQMQDKGYENIPSHVEVLNILAKSAGHQNYQSLKAHEENLPVAKSTSQVDYSQYSGGSLSKYLQSLCTTKLRILSKVFPISTASLANESGLSFSTILNLRRRETFNLAYVFSVARLMGIDPAWMLLDQGELPADLAIDESVKAEIQNERIRLMIYLEGARVRDAGSSPEKDEQEKYELNLVIQGLEKSIEIEASPERMATFQKILDHFKSLAR